MIDIRTPSEEHRDQVANVLHVSLNLGAAFLANRAPSLPLDAIRCAFEDGRVLATAGGHDCTQRFGGQDLGMKGIWGVATLPEFRGTGLATGAVTTILREAREQNLPLSALYPATVTPYRRLGYELAGAYTVHEVRLDDLPRSAAGPLPVEEYAADRDLDAVRACYRRATVAANGPIDSDDPTWWPRRILAPLLAPDAVARTVVARGEDGIEGYAAFVQEKEDGDLDVSFRLDCRHLVASTIEGYASLLGYFRGFRGLGQSLRFTGPPFDPLGLLVDEQRVRPVWTFRWMLRLLDVRAALSGRGYPPLSDEALVAVEDALFPENRGPWRIVVRDGEAEVDRADGEHVRPIPVGALSAMFSGSLSPFDAVRLGLVDGHDPAVPVLDRLFAGPTPFMLDFF